MIKTLPEVTSIPEEPHARRHHPKKASYQSYIDCLRWDFGFSCAFCLIHEKDLKATGVQGWALMWTEHFLTRSAEPTRTNEYENCYLCCRRCNTARGSRPRDLPQGRLLDPCEVAWGDHFESTEDLTWRVKETNDTDGVATLGAYALNDDLKLTCRKARQKILLEAWEGYRTVEEMVEELSPDDPYRTRKARRLRRIREFFLSRLSEFSALPTDRSDGCRCDRVEARTLPGWLHRQCRHMR